MARNVHTREGLQPEPRELGLPDDSSAVVMPAWRIASIPEVT